MTVFTYVVLVYVTEKYCAVCVQWSEVLGLWPHPAWAGSVPVASRLRAPDQSSIQTCSSSEAFCWWPEFDQKSPSPERPSFEKTGREDRRDASVLGEHRRVVRAGVRRLSALLSLSSAGEHIY